MKHIKHIILLFSPTSLIKVWLLVMALPCIVNAGDEIVRKNLSGRRIIDGAIFELSDPRYNELRSGQKAIPFSDQTVINTVELRLDPEKLRQQTTAFDFEVSLSVKLSEYAVSAPGNFYTVTKEVQLSLYYDPANPYTDHQLFRFASKGIYKMEITVKSATRGDFPVVLEAQHKVDRIYEMKQVVDYNQGTRFVNEQEELLVYWNYVPGAESYQLEWTFIDDTGIAKDEQGTKVEKKLAPNELYIRSANFTQAGSRVELTENNYRIPLIYGSGYLAYRIRSVGRSHFNGSRKTSYWSTSGVLNNDFINLSNFPDKVYVTGHRKEMNWQVQTVFAEEGKRKSVISYMDGTLRSRQTVTQLNTEEESLIAETIYDKAGNPAIQVLPVPSGENKLDFVPQFNQKFDGLGENYGPDQFEPLKDDHCSSDKIKGLNTTNGASKYYSANNPDLGNDARADYIPDAEYFPLVHTEYMPDQSGRVKRQGGVGKKFQIGGDHDVRYFYSVPEQEDLDRLFGTDVGLAHHYKKITVRDQNGQYSVQYVDRNGNTIATSLVGEAPSNLDPVYEVGSNEMPNYTTTLIKENSAGYSSNANTVLISEKRVVFTLEIQVPKEGTRVFDYELSGASFLDECTDNTFGLDFCAECVYHVNVRLIDECGKDVLGEMIKHKVGEQSIEVGNSSTLTCEQGASFGQDTTWSVFLKEGGYTLVKELILDEDVLDYYAYKRFSPGYMCMLPFAPVEINEENNAEYDECNFDCDDCEEIEDLLLNDPSVKEDMSDHLMNWCVKNCGSNLSEKISYEPEELMLMLDMSPEGQYGKVWVEERVCPDCPLNPGDDPSSEISEPALSGNNRVIRPGEYPLSIYNKNNLLPGKKNILWGADYSDPYLKADWHKPLNPKETNPIRRKAFLSQDGTLDSVVVRKKDGEYTPEIIDENQAVYTGVSGFFKTPPSNLAKVEDFLESWKESWGYSLIVYHPEYYILSYQLHVQEKKFNGYSSNDIDKAIIGANTIEEFKINYKNETGITMDEQLFEDFLEDPVSFDPFFNVTVDYNDRQELANTIRSRVVMQDGTPLKDLAFRLANCPTYDPANPSCVADCDTDESTFDDQAWRVYKGMYVSLKQSAVQMDILAFSIQTRIGCYNGCIGNEEFNFLNDWFFAIKSDKIDLVDLCENTGWNIGFPLEAFNPLQPCNQETYSLYEDKQARYPLPTRVLDEMGIQGTDQCGGSFDPADLKDEAGEIDMDKVSENFRQPVDCPEGNLQLVDAMRARSDLLYYRTCGLCPRARGLDILLKSVTQKDKLTQDDFSLTCPEVPTDPAPFPALDIVIKEAVKGTGDMRWYIEEHVAHDKLRIRIEKEIRTPEESPIWISLYFPEDWDNRFDFTDIDSLCCMQVEDWLLSGVNPGEPGANFFMHAIDIQYITSSGVQQEEVTLLGSVEGMNLADCEFDLDCELTDAGKSLLNLLNVMAYGDESLGVHEQLTPLPEAFDTLSFANQGAGTNFCDDPDATYPFPYHLFLDGNLSKEFNLFGEKSQWRWRTSRADFDPMTIVARIYHEDYPDGISLPPDASKRSYINIHLTKTPDMNFSWIKGFTHMKADYKSDASMIDGQYTEHFILRALVYHPSDDKFMYRDISGKITNVQVAKCTDPTLLPPPYLTGELQAGK